MVWDLAFEALQARKAEVVLQDKREVSLPGGHSTVFFAERFAQAFPGVRDIAWFENSEEINMRLLKLLEAPLTFSGINPIWWWRGGNLHIEHFSNMGDGLFLMDVYELRIRHIAAVNSGGYDRSFVYVEAEAMTPTGVHNYDDEKIEESVKVFGYCSQEYGLVGSDTAVTRAEYDDGAALINGKLVDIRGKAKLRVRYLSPYNFVIAAHGSPINNGKFDGRLKELLNSMLRGEDVMEDLSRDVLSLPKHDR